ncbi:MAG: enoyl-CoA hydratase/isomerase family protein [Planctomycetes bacterium]|nr:enoyl-CoA hydratase/isomerase family protein [Planctomycetota bacterium]
MNPDDAPSKVRYRKDGKIAVLTLEDPPANCYSHAMMRDLDSAILEARFDSEVEVLVLASAGTKFFCAGADIGMLENADPVFKYYFCLHANETLLRLEHTPKLVIAALQGHCVGGGLEVALACDLRIGCRGSGKVGLPEVALGVLPGTGGTQRLTRLVGKDKAIQLMVTGDNFDYERAVDLGIVHELFDAERDGLSFEEQVLEYARRFTTPRKAAMSVGHIKRACQGGDGLPLEQGLALERELQAKLFASADAKEGLSAYLEKRAPNFRGR